jgi:hypothetical protein
MKTRGIFRILVAPIFALIAYGHDLIDITGHSEASSPLSTLPYAEEDLSGLRLMNGKQAKRCRAEAYAYATKHKL